MTRCQTPRSSTRASAPTSTPVSPLSIRPTSNSAPIECRSGLAYWDDGRLVQYTACQGAHPTRDVLSKIYSLPNEKIRVVVPDMGGGFGVKSRTTGEELLLGWLSRAAGRPVRYTETRTEAMQVMPQGRGQMMNIKMGGTRAGPSRRPSSNICSTTRWATRLRRTSPTTRSSRLPSCRASSSCTWKHPPGSTRSVQRGRRIGHRRVDPSGAQCRRRCPRSDGYQELQRTCHPRTGVADNAGPAQDGLNLGLKRYSMSA